jgi:hypothetical protein
MKQLFLGIVLLLCCYSNGFGQFQIHPDSSFYTLIDSFYTYYQEDSAEGGIYNQMCRDNRVWGTRLAPTGRMGPAATAMTNYAKTYSTPLPTNTLVNTLITPSIAANTAWTELGPTNVPTGIGQVHRIAFHPQYNGTTNQIIYAGSHYGGLFRTDDGGQNWVNWYTDRGLPITSVSGIAVSNNNLFVCTGNGDLVVF